MTDELKPCPFCGEDAEHVHVCAYEEIVRCTNECCFVRPSITCELPEECFELWNTRAAGASEGQAVGFMMKHKTGMDIGFAWKQDDPKFSADWIRIPLYLHPSAEIPALRERIAGMEKDASGDRAAALERLRGFMAAYQEEWSDDNLNSLLDVIAMEKHP